MKLYEAIASALADEADGVIFGLLGDGNMPLWASIAAQGRVRMISARNEAAAVAMADGYFRATGKVGIALTTCGPGLTQAGTSLVVASHNRSPVVVVAGDVPPGALNKLQDLDQKRFAEACGARSFSVSSADDAALEISEAFFAARTTHGPVVLNLPMNIQDRSFDWDWDYRRSADFAPLLQEAASTEALLPIADALESAERPVIIGGRGAKTAGARDAIIELADRTGALLATSLQAKGMFEGHEYDIGIAGSFGSASTEELLAEADFVLGIGAAVGYFTAEGGLLFPSARVARIDIAPAPRELGTIPALCCARSRLHPFRQRHGTSAACGSLWRPRRAAADESFLRRPPGDRSPTAGHPRHGNEPDRAGQGAGRAQQRHRAAAGLPHRPAW